MSGQLHDTINKLDLLRLMYLSREGDRREGVLLRQSKGWFQVAGMGHEALAVISLLTGRRRLIFFRTTVIARWCSVAGVSNYDLALAYFAKVSSSSAGRQMPGHYSVREKNIWSVPTPTAANCCRLRRRMGTATRRQFKCSRGHNWRCGQSPRRILRGGGLCRRKTTAHRLCGRRQRLRHQHEHRPLQSVQT